MKFLDTLLYADESAPKAEAPKSPPPLPHPKAPAPASKPVATTAAMPAPLPAPRTATPGAPARPPASSPAPLPARATPVTKLAPSLPEKLPDSGEVPHAASPTTDYDDEFDKMRARLDRAKKEPKVDPAERHRVETERWTAEDAWQEAEEKAEPHVKAAQEAKAVYDAKSAPFEDMQKRHDDASKAYKEAYAEWDALQKKSTFGGAFSPAASRAGKRLDETSKALSKAREETRGPLFVKSMQMHTAEKITEALRRAGEADKVLATATTPWEVRHAEAEKKRADDDQAYWRSQLDVVPTKPSYVPADEWPDTTQHWQAGKEMANAYVDHWQAEENAKEEREKVAAARSAYEEAQSRHGALPPDEARERNKLEQDFEDVGIMPLARFFAQPAYMRVLQENPEEWRHKVHILYPKASDQDIRGFADAVRSHPRKVINSKMADERHGGETLDEPVDMAQLIYRHFGDPDREALKKLWKKHGRNMPYSYAREEKAEPLRRRRHALALGRWYAQHFNDLHEAGWPVDQEEQEQVARELRGSGVALWQDEEGDGWWRPVLVEAREAKPVRYTSETPDPRRARYEQLLSRLARMKEGTPQYDATMHDFLKEMDFLERTKHLDYAAERAPKGGITIGGKFYAGGRWIPSDAVQNASPEDRAKFSKADVEAKAKRRSRGDVDEGKLRDALKEHAHNLTTDELRSARRAYHGLRRHHGDLTLHRIEELVHDTAHALSSLPGDHPNAEGIKEQFGKRLRGYGHMLDWAREHGIDGKLSKGEEHGAGSKNGPDQEGHGNDKVGANGAASPGGGIQGLAQGARQEEGRKEVNHGPYEAPVRTKGPEPKLTEEQRRRREEGWRPGSPTGDAPRAPALEPQVVRGPITPEMLKASADRLKAKGIADPEEPAKAAPPKPAKASVPAGKARVSGNTYPHKDRLKYVGGSYDPVAKAWFVPLRAAQWMDWPGIQIERGEETKDDFSRREAPLVGARS